MPGIIIKINSRKETNNVTYKEARVYLDEVSKYGSVLGLDAIRRLLCELGNPQEELRFIHIAGTNGKKGSVLAYTSTILSESGLKDRKNVSPSSAVLSGKNTGGRTLDLRRDICRISGRSSESCCAYEGRRKVMSDCI